MDLSKVQNSHSVENGSVNVDTLLSENNPSNPTSGHETPLSVGEILSSFDPGISIPSQSSEYSVERQSNKINGSHPHVKRINFWGRNNVSKKCTFFFACFPLIALFFSMSKASFWHTEFHFVIGGFCKYNLVKSLIHMHHSCRQERANTRNQSIHLVKKSKLFATKSINHMRLHYIFHGVDFVDICNCEKNIALRAFYTTIYGSSCPYVLSLLTTLLEMCNIV